MKRHLNFSFLACLAGAAAVCIVAGYWFHGYQIRRNASQLKATAALAKEAHDYAEAVKVYNRYLQLVPLDGDARADFALALDQVSRSPKERKAVFFALEKALLQSPERDDARRRLVHVAIEIGDFSAAQDHVTRLMQASPGDAELDNLMGRCLVAHRKFVGEKDPKDGAVYWFTKAIGRQPRSIDSYVRLADLYRGQLNKPKQADDVMDGLVKADPSADALVARARYYRAAAIGHDDTDEFLLPAKAVPAVMGSLAQNGTGPGALHAAQAICVEGSSGFLLKAEEDMRQARLASPDDADVLLESAALAQAMRWFDRAQAFALRGVNTYPADLRLYTIAVKLSVRVGKRAEVLKLVRQGTKAMPQETGLLLLLADLLISEGQLDEAKTLIARLKSARDTDPAILDYLEGRRLMADGADWLEASKSLQRAYTGLTRQPERARECALLLGKCYEQLGDPDQQYRAYRSAFTEDPADPLWFPAAEGIARTLLALNKVQEALDAYRRLIPRAPGVRLVVARLLILHNLTLPLRQRDWHEVDRVLKEADSVLPKSTELSILHIQLLAAMASYQEASQAQKTYEEAIGVLQQARAADPANVSLLVVHAGLEDSRPSGNALNALKVLDQGEKEFTDSRDLLELRLARIRFLLQLEGNEAVKGLEFVEKSSSQFKPADQLRLWRELAEAYTSAGELRRSRQLWEQIANRKSTDLGARLHLFDLAELANDDADMERLIREIQHLEGDNGTLWLYAAAALRIHRAQKGDKKALDEARPMLATVGARRPTWSRVPVCQARIETLLGNADGAIRNYLTAVDMGERSPFVLLETIRLLRQHERYAEAYQVIRKLPEQSPLLRQINDLVIDLSLRAKDRARALDLATKALDAQPNDYHAHLSLGQVYWALGDGAKAKDAIRAAVKLKDDVPETWTTLILFLAQSDQKEEAIETIGDAQRKLPLNKNRLAYAQCYEAVGQLEKAQSLYKEALVDVPTDIPTLRAAAAFLLRTGKPNDAQPLLLQLVNMRHQAPEEAASARRLLALVLAADGTDNEQKHKLLAELGYLDTPRDSVEETPDDKRMRAILLAAQGTRKNRAGAIKVFEDIAKLQPLTNADKFLLAQLHDSLGNPGQSVQLMRSVVSDEEDNPLHLAYLVGVLIASNSFAEADAALSRLAKIQPRAWQTVELQARRLAAEGDSKKAGALVLKYVDGETDPPLLQIAGLLEAIQDKAGAQTIYERYADKLHQPMADLMLAEFLGRAGKTEAALDLCDRVRAQASPASAMTAAVAILYATPSNRKDQDRVEGWIKEAVQSTKDPKLRAAQWQCLATLYNLQSRFGEAEAAYRDCLKDDPNNVLAMNNLAWVLATTGTNTQEALAWIQKAISQLGPRSELLDTRAIVYLTQGKADLALKDSEEVVADKPTASRFFHLARIHFAANDKKGAREDLRKATDLGLSEKDLNPLERVHYRQLLVDPGVD